MSTIRAHLLDYGQKGEHPSSASSSHGPEGSKRPLVLRDDPIAEPTPLFSHLTAESSLFFSQTQPDPST